MAIITLTTDLGTQDFYVPYIKGCLLSQFPQSQIVDISHHVPPFDSVKAAYILNHCFRAFPKGSIHCVSINPNNVEDCPYVMMEIDGHFFIATDDGFFSGLVKQNPAWMISLIPEEVDERWITFPSIPFFIHGIKHILAGSPKEAGTLLSDFNRRTFLDAYVMDDSIIGYINYVDKFGNAISNIHQQFFHQVAKGRAYNIETRTSEFFPHT
jgi:S-adenosyl-L-methionine hydrolase (adenosine-forming)